MVVAYTIGRILIPLFFIVSGIQKALNVAGIAKMMADSNLPVSDDVVAYLAKLVPQLSGIPKYELLGYVVAGIEVICGVMVMVGLKARWAALMLILFTACTIIYVHHFWDMSGAEFISNQTEALKNLAIIGGLLMVVALGSGPSAMDRPRA